MIICPCKDCKNRNIGCHVFCSDYRYYRNEMDKRNTEIRKQDERTNDHIKSICKIHWIKRR